MMERSQFSLFLPKPENIGNTYVSGSGIECEDRTGRRTPSLTYVVWSSNCLVKGGPSLLPNPRKNSLNPGPTQPNKTKLDPKKCT